jgi:predicted DNA binding CopG/RHH family protein
MDQKKLDELRAYYDNTDTSAEIADAELDDEVVRSPMVGITVRLPAELLEKVRQTASQQGVKTTALIRRWIDNAVETDNRLPAGGGFLGLSQSAGSADPAALGPRSSIVAAGDEEVSAQIAGLSGAHAQAFEALSAQAAEFHQRFVQLMNAVAGLLAGVQDEHDGGVLGEDDRTHTRRMRK